MNTATISVTHPPVTAATRSHGTGLDAQSVRDAAKGQWRHIVTRLGIHVPASPKQHGPCPACGGKDRFRFDDQEGRGTWFCNQCSPQAGDGFALIQNVFSCDFPHALETVALEIGHNRQNSKQERPIVATYDYTDEAGTLLFQVVRFEPKNFRQRR